VIEMGRDCEGHLDETWVTVLVAVNLSLLVNVVANFDMTLRGGLTLVLAAVAAITLMYYCTRRTSDLAGIEEDLRMKEIAENREVYHNERKIIIENYSHNIPRLLKNGRIVIVLTVFALLFTFGTSSGGRNSGKINRETHKLDTIERKIDALTKQLE